MRRMFIAVLATGALALSACDRQKAADVGDDAQAAASKVAEETKDIATSPEMKEMGAELKEAAKDVGAVAKDAAGEAKQAIHEATAPKPGEADTGADAPN